ncbi:hypothetical protein [Micromonospora narathiwatensis]|uniref:Uncharacterized protein n=1 Tax=Micromonospora narathiwatensis TaxID=299146 RepID=A0A1A8Z2E9_9ACTN|nr:hypothetical protein [Micromonospora narathiwatensis]SBT38088.1 hypothetical protein GA0070621_0303 [Micromonospora narathiwatensis]
MRSNRTSRLGAFALITTLAMTGCGVLGGPDRPEGTQATAVAATETVADLGAVVATRDAQITRGRNLYSVRVELYELRRRDGFVNVNVKMTRTDQGTGNDDWQVGDTFEGDTISLTFAGVTLVDRKNRKRYLVARVDPDTAPGGKDSQYLASTNLSKIFVKPDQSIWLYATFGAPPDDVTAVDVVIPRVPVFENVPLG